MTEEKKLELITKYSDSILTKNCVSINSRTVKSIAKEIGLKPSNYINWVGSGVCINDGDLYINGFCIDNNWGLPKDGITRYIIESILRVINAELEIVKKELIPITHQS